MTVSCPVRRLYIRNWNAICHTKAPTLSHFSGGVLSLWLILQCSPGMVCCHALPPRRSPDSLERITLFSTARAGGAECLLSSPT